MTFCTLHRKRRRQHQIFVGRCMFPTSGFNVLIVAVHIATTTNERYASILSNRQSPNILVWLYLGAVALPLWGWLNPSPPGLSRKPPKQRGQSANPPECAQVGFAYSLPFPGGGGPGGAAKRATVLPRYNQTKIFGNLRSDPWRSRCRRRPP